MKHVKSISMPRAAYTAEEINGFLDRIFGFVTALVNVKGKNSAVDA